MSFYELKDYGNYSEINIKNYPKIAFISVYNEPFKDFYDMDLPEGKYIDTYSLLESLLENFGYPDMIISSPYLIPRQTCNILYAMIKEKMDYEPNIHINKFLSTRFKENQAMEGTRNIDKEYFGIKESSLLYDPIIYYEKYGCVLDRINQFCKSLGFIGGDEINNSDKIIYVITHDFIVALAYQYLWNNPSKKENFFSLNAFTIDYLNENDKCKKYCLIPEREQRRKNYNHKNKKFVNKNNYNSYYNNDNNNNNNKYHNSRNNK